MIAAQGGDPLVCDDVSRLPTARHREPVLAPRSGIVYEMDTRGIGMAAVTLGAGRAKTDDVIEPSVGLEMAVRLGDEIQAGQPMVWIHHDGRGTEQTTQRLLKAISIEDDAPTLGPLVMERVTAAKT